MTLPTATSNLLPGLRSIETLAGSVPVFSQPGGSSADGATLQLSSILPLGLGGAEAGADVTTPAPDAGAPANPEVAGAGDASAVPLTAAAEQVPLAGAAGSVLSLADIAGPQAGVAETLAQPGDLITQLSNSLVDLGYPNGKSAMQAVTSLPGEVTGLNDSSRNVADILYHSGLQYVGPFVNEVAGTVSNVTSQPLATTANDTILDFHLLIEGVSHELGVGVNTVHAVTNLGETIGLGKIGQDNLVTDIVNLPGNLLNSDSPLDPVGEIVGHVGDILTGATDLVSALPKDLGSGSGLLGSDGLIGGSALDLGGLGDLLSQDSGGLPGAVGGLVDNATNLLDGLGTNSDGSLNLVTDVLNMPGELLSGQGTPSLTDAGLQLDTTVTAAGDLVQNVLGGASSGNLLDTVATSLDQFGNAAGPAIGIPLTLTGVDAVTASLGLGAGSGDPNPAGALAAVQQTVNGVVQDVSNDAALAGLGNSDGIAVPGLGGLGLDSLVGGLTQGLPVAGGEPAAPVTADAAPLADGLLGTVTGLLGLGEDQHQHHGMLGGLGLA
ncbi:hypothetical protein [Bosea sp. BK604]|uniref:hypothetical protein n=1 Tax=Bosea sp. BK604 TaxID=2512180 RepID=UPI001047AF05|nr:hypothetical protein [Bosea sp. BK604]TCR66359.1 hypothetical protein EV560_104239 [Bosea sp. BK604]